MIYSERMITSSEATYNFRIFKVVSMLYKLNVIDIREMLKHISIMEQGKPIGIFIDYNNYTVEAGPGVITQF